MVICEPNIGASQTLNIWKDICINIKQFFKSVLLNIKFKNKYHFKRFCFEEYKKKSDTIFILGTGRSIDEITNKQWNFIKKHDSLALNLFPFCDFIPNIYMFEHIRDKKARNNWLSIIKKYYNHKPYLILTSNYSLNLIETNSEYLEMKKILNKKLFNKLRFYPIYFARHYSIHTFYFSRFLSKLLPKSYLLHVRGSISVAIDFAVKMKYKNIVLCGIDLDNRGHFYDPPMCTKDLHKTALRINGLTSIDDYLLFCKKYFKYVNFFVASKKSRLSNFMSIYEWI